LKTLGTFLDARISGPLPLVGTNSCSPWRLGLKRPTHTQVYASSFSKDSNTGGPQKLITLLSQLNQTSFTNAATLEQFDIGWFNFLLGRIAKHWALAPQDAHYKSLGKRHTGQSWAKGLILVELWTINWNFWEHRNTRKHTEDTPVHYAKNQRVLECSNIYYEIRTKVI